LVLFVKTSRKRSKAKQLKRTNESMGFQGSIGAVAFNGGLGQNSYTGGEFYMH
jgi:hypothetical protein